MEQKKEVVLCFEKKEPLVIGDLTFISAYDFSLTDYELEKARRTLNETEEKKEKCLQNLKEKLRRDEKFPYRTDNDYLLRYLRHSKFDCDKACKIIRNFYCLRKKHAEYVTIPPNLKILYDSGFITCLPYTDEDRHLVFWFNFRIWKMDEMSLTQMIQMAFTFCDIFSMNPGAQVNGFKAIWDFRGVTARHVTLVLYPNTLWFFSKFLQDSFPWKIKYIIGIHCNKLIRYAYSAIRPLLKQKIADRVNLIGSDMSELHKYINPLILPKEYGGFLEESECSATKNILQNLDYLQYERSFVNVAES